MKIKNAIIDRMETMQDHDPMEELHYEAHHAMMEAAKNLTMEQLVVLCICAGLNSGDYQHLVKE